MSTGIPVILVNEYDTAVGTMEKMEAHIQGKLHRAFSVFIFNSKGELLMQQRAAHKYHSGGKWTNTCCSHPYPGEQTSDAAGRRLAEEMGMTCTLTPVFSFVYHAVIQDNIIEHEYDHVFFGISDSQPVPDPEEVASYKYTTMADLEKELENDPLQYTAWLRICFDQVNMHYKRFFT